MSDNLLKLIKRAALDAVKEYGLCDGEYGIVEKLSPLSIRTDTRKLLTDEFLVLTKNVSDYETEITLENGKKQKAVIHNSLKKGDCVILLKIKRNQEYIILDKL